MLPAGPAMWERALVPPYDVSIASFAELDLRTAYLLWQLRESVFVVEQRCPYPELDGRDLDPGTRHLWVAEADRPVAYLRLLDDGDHARIGRVCVRPAHRGRGLAAALMRTALTVLADRPVRLDAQAHLVDWYAGFGFEVTGPEFLDDGIPHRPMRRGPTP